MRFIFKYQGEKIGKEQNERYLHYLIQNDAVSNVKLISKKIVKKFVREFFRSGKVMITYRDVQQSIDCRSGYLQLDIFQIYGADAQIKPPYETSNPIGIVSIWGVGEVAWAELKESGCIKFTPFAVSSSKENRK